MYLLMMILLIFFAIIGLCAFITALLDITYRGSYDAVLLMTDMLPANAEARIRTAARICQHHTHLRLICVCTENNPAYDICRLMQKEYPFLEIVDDYKV